MKLALAYIGLLILAFLSNYIDGIGYPAGFGLYYWIRAAWRG